MNTRRLITLSTIGALALGLTACGGPVGPRTTEERDVEDVTAVRLSTSGNLTVEQGDTPSLTITAGEEVLPRLTSEVRDGVLVLGLDRSGWGAVGSIRYHLVLPELDAISVEGSGDVEADVADGQSLAVTVEGSGDVRVDAVDVEAVTVSIAGSGDVSLAGDAARQGVVVEGSGEYQGGGLRTEDTVVSIEGSGDVVVEVTDALEASIAGSGSVTHTGGAKVSSSIAGSGSVREG
mgnify:CR=1 FL=1